MASLFWLLIIVILVGVSIWYLTGGSRSRPATSGARQPGLLTLQLGDIVQYNNIDWAVEDKLIYNQNGWEWFDYLLQDGDRIGFLSVEDDDTLEVTFTEKVTDCPVEVPPPSSITYQQQIFNRSETGTATLKRQRHPERPVETCQFHDYNGPNDAVMSVEVWNGSVEVSVGVKVRPYQLTFLPGDGESVYRSDM